MSEEIEFVIDRKNRVDFKQVINMKIQYEVLINELKQRIAKAQEFIRNESSLNDAEIDELAMILEGDI